MRFIAPSLTNYFWILFALTVGLFSCKHLTNTPSKNDVVPPNFGVDPIASKPYARYWWFASEIQKDDVRFNLDWLKANGFGGVEIAWVYPLNRKSKPPHDPYTPRQAWLSPEWQAIVEFAILYADSIGLACDLTMGTLWPFGDSYVPYSHASQQFGKKERQELRFSWEHPQKGYVIDHIHPAHYTPYLNRILDSFPQPTTQLPQAYFIDSWEVKTEQLWTDGFDSIFQQRFGYDIKPYMSALYHPTNKAILYDYRRLISERVIQFYRDFDRLLDAKNIQSRGQCSGAPADIISAYACLDIPEGESMLYEPEYNSIPASAALLSGKPMVSAETFTCLYGWPAHYLREEQTADLKLVADALFANGINRIVWHGKAHNTQGTDSTNFYATVHLGNNGALAAELPAFNQYLTQVSALLQQGNTYSQVAVYLPTEDAWIKGIMPKEKQFIWAKEYYEMRYVYFPEEVAGHHPIWINSEFLNKAIWEDGLLQVGDAAFQSLYVDATYLDAAVLQRLATLAQQGLPITLKQAPAQAGTAQDSTWATTLQQLQALPNVTPDFNPPQAPLITAPNSPPYWARETDTSLLLFFAHPQCRGLTFPLEYGQSYTDSTITIPITIHYQNKTHRLELSFAPNQSLAFEIKDGQINSIDIGFQPKTPVVKARPEGFEARWLVE